MKTIALFNNKGGVGKTSLVYHLAWMYSELGLNVIAVDLDPQANLTSMFLDENRLEALWPDGDHPQSILGMVSPILRGTGDIAEPHIEQINSRLGLLVGDLGLSRFEANLSDDWPKCLEGEERPFRTISAFHRMIAAAAGEQQATLVLIDVGPNLGAINRAAILCADFVAVPLASDLFSLQGLKNLGPALRSWRGQWQDRLTRAPQAPDLQLPAGNMMPIGYIIMQHAMRMDRPVKAYQRWMARIPSTYLEAVLDKHGGVEPKPENDPNCLAMLKNYRSLMPLAQDALKPMFHLKAADGALGGHIYAVRDCYEDFRALARAIAQRCKIELD